MRIALVSPYDFAIPSGVNSHILHLCREYERLGHQVNIFAPYSARSGEGIPNLTAVGNLRIALPAGGSIARVSLGLGVRGAVKKLLEGEEFSVIHVHEPFMPYLPLQFLRFSQALNIGTFHAVKDRGNRLYALFKPLVNRYLARMHGRTAVSPVARALISRYYPGDYEVIPNGIEYHHFSKQRSPLDEGGGPVLLFVGRQEKRKGLIYLLQAYDLVKRQVEDARLIIVGPDGGSRKECLRAIDDMRLRDVLFTGFVSYDDLPRYYQSATVFCAPNLGNESFGIVLLEAMAAGAPVIASDIEGFAAVVNQGVDGVLVPPRDPKALAEAIMALLCDEEQRQMMAGAGREKAKGYDWSRIARETIAYYHQAAESHGKAHLLQAAPFTE